MNMLAIPDISWGSIAPELALIGTAVVVVFLDLFGRKGRKDTLGYFTVLGMVVALAFMLFESMGVSRPFGGMIAIDGFTRFLTVLVLGVAILVTLMSVHALRAEEMDEGGYHVLVLLATVGMLLMVKGMDLIIIFIFLVPLCL